MEISSTSDYLEKCFRNPRMRGTDYAVFFRGVTREYPRETRYFPSLYHPPHRFYEREDDIFKETISIFPDEMLAQKSAIEKLILMQHYEFPTRILDISKNPFTALFFACFADRGREESLQEDGMVYVFAVPKSEIKFCDSDSVSVLANLCKRPATFNITRYLDMDIPRFNSEVEEIQFLIHEIKEEKPYFRSIIKPETFNSVICLRPRLNNPRIVRQDGYFFLFGIQGEKKTPAELPPDWIQNPFIIPARRKAAILAELDALNINEAYVYPDFQHVNEVLRKRYSSSSKER